MSGRDRALVAVAAAGALGWGTIVVAHATPTGVPPFWPLKGLAVAALALLAWRHRGRVPGATWLAAALAAHAAGDLLLEKAPFLAGVAAFALGHALLVALFWRHRLRWDDVRGGAKLRLGLLALVGALVLAGLSGGLRGQLAVAVPAYALTLLAMAATAQLARRGQPWVAAGAFTFVLSDGLLGLALFRHVVAARPLVWPLYAAAQFALTLGWLYGPAPTPDEAAPADA